MLITLFPQLSGMDDEFYPLCKYTQVIKWSMGHFEIFIPEPQETTWSHNLVFLYRDL